MRAWIGVLPAAQREHETRAMKRQLEEDFEREIAKVQRSACNTENHCITPNALQARAKMMANVEARAALIGGKWDKVMGTMETHFAVEVGTHSRAGFASEAAASFTRLVNPFRFQIQEVTKMRDAVLEHTLNDKSEKLSVLKKAADDIFAPAATLKLALLGKLWGYDALYDSCKARIIADPMPHASSPLWKSPLLCAGVRRCSSSPPSFPSSSRSRDPCQVSSRKFLSPFLPAPSLTSASCSRLRYCPPLRTASSTTRESRFKLTAHGAPNHAAVPHSKGEHQPRA